jgi:hypothetical protein
VPTSSQGLSVSIGETTSPYEGGSCFTSLPRVRSAGMFRALILIRNLESGAEGLDFGGFTIGPVRFRFKELEKFSHLWT